MRSFELDALGFGACGSDSRRTRPPDHGTSSAAFLRKKLAALGAGEIVLVLHRSYLCGPLAALVLAASSQTRSVWRRA